MKPFKFEEIEFTTVSSTKIKKKHILRNFVAYFL